MLSITNELIEEDIKIGNFIESFFSKEEIENTLNEILKSCDFNIEVESNNKFNKIEAIRRTTLENICKLTLTSGIEIIASPKHIVMTNFGWKFIKELSIQNDLVMTKSGLISILKIENFEIKNNLFDLQVSNEHSYYTNEILSHNSHMLVNIGASALKLKKNVLHYTFELSDINVGIRYDSHLCEIDSDQVFQNKEKVLDFYKENKNNLGRLKIKEYPMNSATVLTLKAHIDKLKISGFFPDIVLIDYADIMRSTRQFDSLRHELKLIYEELRGLAQELKIPICTASQSNKDGTNADVIDETNMSEGFGKAFVCDEILTISRKPLEKSTGKGRIFLAKNRAGKDGLLYPVSIDTAQSRFLICGSQITQSEATESDEKEMKKVLKKKWEELQKDKSVKLVDSKSTIEESQTIIQPQVVESVSSQQNDIVS